MIAYLLNKLGLKRSFWNASRCFCSFELISPSRGTVFGPQRSSPHCPSFTPSQSRLCHTDLCRPVHACVFTPSPERLDLKRKIVAEQVF